MKEADILPLLSQSTPHSIRVFPLLASTNLTLREMAEAGAPHGTAVIAEAQTAGRGRLGREFASPPEAGLYMSMLVRMPIPAASLGRMTPYAAVAAARAIEATAAVQVGIKWVNDLRIGDRKIAGILTEGGFTPTGELAFGIVGIGVNLLPGALPPSLAGIAAAIGDHAVPPSREVLAAAILDRFYRNLSEVTDGSFMEEYRRRSVVIGRTVTAQDAGRTVTGVATAIEDDGALRLATAEGEILLRAGEVSIRL